MKIQPLLFAAAASMGLMSCGTMDATRETSVVGRISQFSLSDLRPAKIAVVEVNEKALKELPTGQERALAFERSRKRSLWGFAGPVVFKEPVLPDGGGAMDGGLLPPKLE